MVEPIIKTHIESPPSIRGIEEVFETHIKYTIEGDCSISNIEILKGSNKDCNDEAIKSVKRIEELLIKHSKGGCQSKVVDQKIQFKPI